MFATPPALHIWIYSRAAFAAEARAKVLVEYLVSHTEFAPNRFGPYEPLRRFTPDKISEAIELIVAPLGQQMAPDRVRSLTFFERTCPPRCSYVVEWSRLPHRAFEICSYSIRQQDIEDPLILSRWLDFVLGMLDVHDAWYALLALDAETDTKNFLMWLGRYPGENNTVGEGGRGVGLELTQGSPGVYWGNYLGPFYVNWFGRDKLDLLPAVEKRWLDTGGLFFTTAASPLEWDAAEARRLQTAIQDHLGADAFYDMETVRSVIAELEPIPGSMPPETFQPPRRVPEFPFQVIPPAPKPVDQEIAEAKQAFENIGLALVRVEGLTLVFRGEGGITKVTVGPHGRVEHWPGASL